LIYFADLNKPVLLDAYTILETNENGKRITTYKAKDLDQTGVRDMKLIANADGEAERLEASYFDENFIYQNKREITLNMSNGMLDSYTMKVKQQMIFKNPIEYAIDCEVRK